MLLCLSTRRSSVHSALYWGNLQVLAELLQHDGSLVVADWKVCGLLDGDAVVWDWGDMPDWLAP